MRPTLSFINTSGDVCIIVIPHVVCIEESEMSDDTVYVQLTGGTYKELATEGKAHQQSIIASINQAVDDWHLAHYKAL